MADMTYKIYDPDILPKCSGHQVVLDTETTGLKWYRPGIHINGVGIECPTAGIHGFIHCMDERRREWVYEEVQKIDKGTTVIMHNAKFDLHFLKTDPEKLGWNVRDIPVMLSNIDSRPQHKRALAFAENLYLGTDSKRQHLFNAPSRKKIWEWDPEVRADYGYNDALVTFQLYEKLQPMLEALKVWRIFLKDMEFLKVIWKAENYGIVLDLDFIERAIPKQAQHVDVFENDLWDACGYEFNWRSHQQLSDAIYRNLGISKPKNPFADADGVDRSKLADKGLYKSTCTSTFLLREKVKHPLADNVANLREAYRMLRTMEKYAELIDEDENAVHANFKQARTRTHRLSCSDPNLQNVPSQVRGRFTQSVYSGDTTRLEEYNLRTAFCARPGKKLLSVDYKQMEMRMFGILAEDPFMLEALGAGKDIHAEIAAKVWGKVNKTTREWSKTIGFGLVYGMTVGSLMFKLNQTHKQAKRIRDDYVREFPRIMPWMAEVITECGRANMIRYWDGKIWRESNPMYRYKAANAKIQGGCAEILSIAGIRVNEWCKKQGDDHKIVNFVHDELMLEVPEEDVIRSAQEVGKIMEVDDLFIVPFYTDAKAGDNYGNQEKLFGKASYETAEDAKLTTAVKLNDRR